MKTDTCIYSGLKIYPGHGKRMIRTDGKVLIFLNPKCERSFKLKKNPRNVNWTVLYRRKHKKGTMAEEIQKKRTRRAQKFQRAIGATSLADIMAKRNQKPEVRKAQREQAIKAAKEKQRAVKQAKTVEKQKVKSTAPKQKVPKPVKVNQPRVGMRR